MTVNNKKSGRVMEAKEKMCGPTGAVRCGVTVLPGRMLGKFATLKGTGGMEAAGLPIFEGLKITA